MNDQKRIVIQRKWYIKLSDDPSRLQQIPIHLETFTSDDLPNIRFSIFSGISDKDKLTVVVTKTIAEPVKAMIRVSIDGDERKIVRTGCWMTQCTLDDIQYIAFYSCSSNSMITVECDITWYGFTHKSDPAVDLYFHTKKLYRTDSLTDVIIMVNDAEFPVHKIILAAQSPVFMSMFQNNMLQHTNNNRIRVKGVDTFTITKLLEFLYTGEINTEMDVDVFLSILNAAHEFQIIELKKKCTDALFTKLTINNSLKILERAAACDVPELIECITIFMVDNKEEISELNGFEELYRRKPETLFQFLMSIIKKKY